ncbi:glycosyltransferase [Streptococcus suis]
MKVAVIDFAASRGGALTILLDFVNYIKENKRDIQWIFLLSDYYFEETENIKIHIIKKDIVNRLKFDFFLGARVLKKYDVDVVLNFQNTFVYNISCPQIIYLHQTLPFQKNFKFSPFKRSEFNYWYIQFLLGALIKKGLFYADKVIVQQEWLKHEIKSYVKNCQNIMVIPPNVVLQDYYSNDRIENTKFFYPTSNFIYKNIETLEKAVEILNHKGLKFSVEITTIKRTDIPNIIYSGMLERSTVLKKMATSVLVFPSLVESFGLPLEEARQLGTYIIASDTLFGSEILKNYENKEFFSGKNEKELALIMEKIITNKTNVNKIGTPTKNKGSNNWDMLLVELQVLVDENSSKL